MTGIAIDDESYKTVESLIYDLRTTRKDVVERMIKFADNHKEDFILEMF